MVKYMVNEKDKMKMAYIPEQIFKMGTSDNFGHPLDREGPPKTIKINSFYMSRTTVTNRKFKKFVDETDYVTDAETIGSSFVFNGLITDSMEEKINYIHTSIPWWWDVSKANWKQPEGPNSSIENRMEHPVVHISWNDAMAYSKWAGGRLPSEAEWEAAASANEEKSVYPWGDELVTDGVYRANIWQGEFPDKNTNKDGYFGTAPVDKFYENEYGLYQMIGNVWEWCLNPGQIPLNDFNKKSAIDFLKESDDKQAKSYATRGGSFLCHRSYCNRYRLAARNSSTTLSTASNTGFRYVLDHI